MPSPTQGHHRNWLDSRLILFAILFLVSGAAGLIYEIAWERLLELYFGVTMIAITLIVSAYMAGLGLGSLVGGRLARRVKSPLPVYGLIEIGIGLFGLASPALFPWIGQATAGSPYYLVFILSFLVLLVPTFLMGTTLPLLSQAFITRVDISGRVVGLLYGINTLGAAVGALLAGYVLIGASGLDGAIRYAFVLNAGIGLLAILVDRWRAAAAPPPVQGNPAPTGLVRWGYRSVLFASFLTGFLGLGYEMLWIRVLHITNKSTAYSFPTILAIFLLGLAVGGYAWGSRADRAPDPVRLFVRIELAVGITAGLSFLIFFYGMNFPAFQAWLGENFNNLQQPASPMVAPLGEYVFSRRALVLSLLEYLPPFILVILPASLLMGGGLPVLDRIAIESPEIAGQRVGEIHLANILGSVAGSLVISFIFLPVIGSEWTLRILVAASLAFLLLSLANRPGKASHLKALWLPLALVVMVLILIPGSGSFYTRLYEAATGARAETHETGETVLAMTFLDDGTSSLWIGGEENSYFPTRGLWEGQALTCAAASQPRRVLIIGYGGGHTAALIASLPGIEEFVIVELIPDLIPFMDGQMDFTQIILANPRLQNIVDDGRRYLYAHPEEYFDLIIIDPLRNFTSGHNNLYSSEALQLYRRHLTPGGVFCVWQDEHHIIPRTIASAFPYVDQFNNFTIAGSQPLHYNLDVINEGAEAFLSSGLDLPADMDANLAPEELLGRFVRDQDQLLIDEQGTPILTDMQPRLEYYMSNLPFGDQIYRDPLEREEFVARLSGCDRPCQDAILNSR